MKHLVASLSIFAVLLAACTMNCILIRSCVLKTADQLSALQRIDANAAAATQKLEEVTGHWSHHKGFLHAVLRHEEADEIEYNLAELAALQRNDDKAEYDRALASLIAKLHNIADLELPAYYNLLLLPARGGRSL